MELVLVGLSHKTAPVEVRERVAFSERQIPSALAQLLGDFRLHEGMILSTCNRVEVLGHSGEKETGRRIRKFLHRYHQLKDSTLDDFLYEYNQQQLVRHVFRVASSLESMVVGEPQILAQMKQAFTAAQAAGGVGRELQHLIPWALFVAKKVRNDTHIGEAAVSVSSVAVDLARKIFDRLEGKHLLLLGAGKMGELSLKSFEAAGIRDIHICNRNPARAQTLARRFGASVVDFEARHEAMVRMDIVLVSTGASGYLLERPEMEPLMARRKYRPLFLIDISVPRNVDPEINRVGNIFLYDIDDLQSVVESNLEHRHREAGAAMAIIEREVRNFLAREETQRLGPLIGKIRNRIEEICLEEARAHGEGLDPESYRQMERALRRAAHRMAHPLITQLKNPSAPIGRARLAEVFRAIFDMSEEE